MSSSKSWQGGKEPEVTDGAAEVGLASTGLGWYAGVELGKERLLVQEPIEP